MPSDLLYTFEGIHPIRHSFVHKGVRMMVFIDQDSKIGITPVSQTFYRVTYVGDGVSSFSLAEDSSSIFIVTIEDGAVRTLTLQVDPATFKVTYVSAPYPFAIPDCSSVSLRRGGGRVELWMTSSLRKLSVLNKHRDSLLVAPFYSIDLPYDPEESSLYDSNKEFSPLKTSGPTIESIRLFRVTGDGNA